MIVQHTHQIIDIARRLENIKVEKADRERNVRKANIGITDVWASPYIQRQKLPNRSRILGGHQIPENDGCKKCTIL